LPLSGAWSLEVIGVLGRRYDSGALMV